MLCIPHFVHPLAVDGYSGCFPLLAVVSSAAVNICIQYLFEPLLSIFTVFGHISRCQEHFIIREKNKGDKKKAADFQFLSSDL